MNENDKKDARMPGYVHVGSTPAATSGDAPDLHNAIMNLPHGEEFTNFKGHPNTRIAYKIGHRDARHAAAELTLGTRIERAAAPATASGDELPPLTISVYGTRTNLELERQRRADIATRAAVSAATKPAHQPESKLASFPLDEMAWDDKPDSKKVFGVNDWQLTLGDIRAAKRAATKPTADIAHWEGLTDLFGIIAAKHGINDIQVNGGTADELFPRVLAEFIVAASRGAEPDYTFEHLAGRGLHELRADELPAYLASVAHNFGARSTEFTTAAQWVAAEIERKTNDERILAVKLADVQSLLATKPAAVPEGWKLAPTVSTSAMERAGMKALRNLIGDAATQVDAEACYTAMLAAAPSATPAAQDHAKAEGDQQ